MAMTVTPKGRSPVAVAEVVVDTGGGGADSTGGGGVVTGGGGGAVSGGGGDE
jgi:hypothetical protein